MTGKITDYEILSGTSDTELIQIVKTEILKGWEPLGGPILVHDQQGEARLLQALIRRSDSH